LALFLIYERDNKYIKFFKNEGEGIKKQLLEFNEVLKIKKMQYLQWEIEKIGKDSRKLQVHNSMANKIIAKNSNRIAKKYPFLLKINDMIDYRFVGELNLKELRNKKREILNTLGEFDTNDKIFINDLKNSHTELGRYVRKFIRELIQRRIISKNQNLFDDCFKLKDGVFESKEAKKEIKFLHGVFEIVVKRKVKIKENMFVDEWAERYEELIADFLIDSSCFLEEITEPKTFCEYGHAKGYLSAVSLMEDFYYLLDIAISNPKKFFKSNTKGLIGLYTEGKTIKRKKILKKIAKRDKEILKRL